MVKVLADHLTYIVFWTAIVLTITTIALCIWNEAYLPLLILSILFNVWTLFQSERNGFVRAREMRRAFEPPRHFNRLQVVLITLLVMGQSVVGLVVYFS